MTPEEAPVGTIMVIGNRTARKAENEAWYYTDADDSFSSILQPSYDDLHKAAYAVYIPGQSIDYRDLLRKYIQHVADVEGSYFLSEHHRNTTDPNYQQFTDEEWAELQKLH